MELGGPLGNVKKFLEKLPAPGTYEAKDMRDRRAPSLRSRLPDHSLDKIIKVTIKRLRILVLALTTTNNSARTTTT